MPASHNRPILVTGSHRSGSTWVGKMLASHPRVVYLWEPFNPAVPRSPVKYWYHQVTAEEQERFRAFLEPYLTFRYPWWGDIRERIHPRRIVGATLRMALSWWRRHSGCRTLMKDPSALFSAEWLASTYDMDVVVLIRHPAAFVGSWKRLNKHAYLEDLWQQRQLMEGYLQPFHEEIRRCLERPPDLIDQAALLWRVIHHVVRRFQHAHPEWIFVRHEDLSRQPREEFQKLCAGLGLDMTGRMRRTIESHTSAGNPREAPHGVAHQMKRDSLGNIWNWHSRLRSEEIARVRQGTEGIARFFYTDADWLEEADPVRRAA